MKAINIIMASALAGVLLACNPLTVDLKPAMGSFTAQGDGFSTKTSLSGTSVIWSADDAIKVFNGTSSEEYTIESGQGSSTAVFTGNEIEGETYYAVYPYSAGASLSAGVITATVPATQYGVVNSFDKDINLAVACSNNNTLQFKNVCGYLRFQIIDNDINTIVINSNSGNALAGEVAIGFDGEGLPVISSIVDGSSSVTLTPKTGTSFTPGVYIVAVLPGTYSGGITVNMTKQHAKEDALRVYPMTAVKAGTSQLVVSRSVVKTLGIIDQQVAWECLGFENNGIGVGYHYAPSVWGQFIDYQTGRTFGAIGAYNYGTILDACFAYSASGAAGIGVLSTSSTQASSLYKADNVEKIDANYTNADLISNWPHKKTTYFAPVTSAEIATDAAYSAITKYSELSAVYEAAIKRIGTTNNVIWNVTGSAKITSSNIGENIGYYAFKMFDGGYVYYGVFKAVYVSGASDPVLRFIYKIACERTGTPEAIPE